MASLAAFAPSVAALRPKVAKTSKVAKAVVAERRTETVVPAISPRRALLGGAVSAAMTLAMSPSPAAAKDGKNGVYWIAPKDGATVGQEFDVKMGVIGYELAPASEGLQEGTGHHHIVVDQAGGYVDKGTEIPFDATHLHYGKAQKEATRRMAQQARLSDARMRTPEQLFKWRSQCLAAGKDPQALDDTMQKVRSMNHAEFVRHLDDAVDMQHFTQALST